MPFHIDTDGTRRRFSFQVQQGFGGNNSTATPTVDPSVSIAINQSVANAIAAHEAKPDPHPQCLKGELDYDMYYMSQI